MAKELKYAPLVLDIEGARHQESVSSSQTQGTFHFNHASHRSRLLGPWLGFAFPTYVGTDGCYK